MLNLSFKLNLFYHTVEFSFRGDAQKMQELHYIISLIKY